MEGEAAGVLVKLGTVVEGRSVEAWMAFGRRACSIWRKERNLDFAWFGYEWAGTLYR